MTSASSIEAGTTTWARSSFMGTLTAMVSTAPPKR